jgi:hypothetical protein
MPERSEWEQQIDATLGELLRGVRAGAGRLDAIEGRLEELQQAAEALAQRVDALEQAEARRRRARRQRGGG